MYGFLNISRLWMSKMKLIVQRLIRLINAEAAQPPKIHNVTNGSKCDEFYVDGNLKFFQFQFLIWSPLTTKTALGHSNVVRISKSCRISSR